MATTSSSRCIGCSDAPRGVADPGLSASVLIGRCVAFWRIGFGPTVVDGYRMRSLGDAS